MAYQTTFLKRSHVEVKRSSPSLGIQMPPENHIRYSFMSNDLLPLHETLNAAVTNTVSAITHGSRFSWISPLRLPLRSHPLNLSIFAQLAQGLTLKTFLDKESRLHSEDNVRHNRVDIRELDNLMIFLSYGTWRPNRVAFRDNPIVMDSPAQTN